MNLRETFRYLGYHGQEPDEAAKNLAVICWKELEQAAVDETSDIRAEVEKIVPTYHPV